MFHMKRIVFFIFFSLCCAFLISATPQTLDLADFKNSELALEHLQGQQVRVRGFWYPLSLDRGILAPTPHLKSCCIQSPKKIQQQLIVNGELSSLTSQWAVTLEGIFKIDPRYNAAGSLMQFYVLDEAREVQSKHSFSLTAAGVVAVFSGLLFFIKRRSRFT